LVPDADLREAAGAVAARTQERQANPAECDGGASVGALAPLNRLERSFSLPS
jgi:hypothetical protein